MDTRLLAASPIPQPYIKLTGTTTCIDQTAGKTYIQIDYFSPTPDWFDCDSSGRPYTCVTVPYGTGLYPTQQECTDICVTPPPPAPGYNCDTSSYSCGMVPYPGTIPNARSM